MPKHACTRQTCASGKQRSARLKKHRKQITEGFLSFTIYLETVLTILGILDITKYKMADLLTWVKDQLHDLLDISDRSIAEFLVGLCRKSDSPETFLEKIRETETIDINESVASFSRELWVRVPRQISAGEQRRLENRRLEEEQRSVSCNIFFSVCCF